MSENTRLHRPHDAASEAAPSFFPAARGFTAPLATAAPGGGHSISRVSVLAPQAKLTVNTPGDSFEREADAVADNVMRMADPDVDAAPAEADLEAAGPGIQRKESAAGAPGANSGAPDGPPDVSGAVSEGLSGGGQGLDSATRSFMEPRFGHDFSQVKIHTDTRASDSAGAIAARAYTVGGDIAFRSGEYQPGSDAGRRLLAHELTHVVQQGAAGQGEVQAMRAAGPVAISRAAGEDVQRTFSASEALRDGRVTDGFLGADDEAITDEVTGASGVAAAPGAGGSGSVGAASGSAPAAPAAPPVVVTIPPVIQAATSPAGMPNRIPPRVDTPVAVTVSGWSAPMAPIVLSVAGIGGSNGDASIDGAATINLTGNRTVQLRGAVQTAPGSGGNLRLVATSGGSQLASSGGFSVSAIPQDISIALQAPLTGTSRGFSVSTTWQSDSGSRADLDQAQFSEQVQPTAATGCFAGVPPSNSGYLPALTAPLTDTHSTPVSVMTSAGMRTANQSFMFLDARSGANNIPMRNSGFVLTRTVVAVGPGFSITTDKHGASVTANGTASAAGSGSVTLTQAV